MKKSKTSLQEKQTKQYVKNATPITFNNIEFKSKLELYVYKRFEEELFHVNYEHRRFNLLSQFKFHNETIRAWTYLPDFEGDTYFIECKGLMDAVNVVKIKMFKWYLKNNMPNHNFYVVRTQKEVEALILKLKSN